MEKTEKLLAIDYGISHIGLAISEGYLAEPLLTLPVKEIKEVVEKIKKITLENKIDKVIIGVSRGQMAQKTEVFADLLKSKINQPVVLWDENSTSKIARLKMHEAGRSIRYQKKAEHQIAACLILQDYIDTI